MMAVSLIDAMLYEGIMITCLSGILVLAMGMVAGRLILNEV